MAKDKTKDKPRDKEKARPRGKSDRDDPAAGRAAGQRGTAGGATATDTGGGHHASKAHGRPARVDDSLPGNRADLMSLHAAARAKRSAAPLGSDAFRAAVEEIARIEVRIAAVDRAADPPLG